jgi:ribosomal protein L22
MAPIFSDLKSIEFYNYKNVKCEAKVVHSALFKKNYIGLYKYSTYTTAEGLHKESNSYVLYAIPAAKELLSVLSSVIADAEQLTGVRMTIPIDVF